MTELPRSSGVQLHLTSLPGGRLGAEAYRFVDWLAAAGQSWWQVLPLGPPDRLRLALPARRSAFAAWPGFLAPAACSGSRRRGVWRGSWPRTCVLGRLDWARLRGGEAPRRTRCGSQREWEALYAPYAEPPRASGCSATWRSTWRRGVPITSPIPELFQEGFIGGRAARRLLSASGQLWGNPLYDWPALQRRRYRWWVERLRRTASLFDLARIDHVRGFVSYWAVPAGARTAAGGHWIRGPGRAVLRGGLDELGPLALVAEDCGRDHARGGAAARLARVSGDGRAPVRVRSRSFPESVHRFENHPVHRVVYTGARGQRTRAGVVASA